MKAWRAIILAAVAAAALAGCGGSHLTPAPGQAPGGSHPPAPTTSVAAAATPADATPTGGSAAAATLYLQTSEQVPFTGDLVTVTTQASAGAGTSHWLRLASVTISFGDGTSASVTQRLSLIHI